MITAALEGSLDAVDFHKHPIFGFDVPQSCPNVPSTILNPRNTWSNPEAYDLQAKELAVAFHKNFERFKEYASEDILKGSPTI
jgi:phosphoenolpyruvate carboxykinase (ATP)